MATESRGLFSWGPLPGRAFNCHAVSGPIPYPANGPSQCAVFPIGCPLVVYLQSLVRLDANGICGPVFLPAPQCDSAINFAFSLPSFPISSFL
jgi:hypothetical protein